MTFPPESCPKAPPNAFEDDRRVMHVRLPRWGPIFSSVDVFGVFEVFFFEGGVEKKMPKRKGWSFNYPFSVVFAVSFRKEGKFRNDHLGV